MRDNDRSRSGAGSRWQGRLGYLALGLVICVACVTIETMAARNEHWFAKPVFPALLGNSFWLALLGVLAARLYFGRVVRPIPFAVGLFVPPLLLVGWLLYGPTVADHWHRTEFDAATWRAEPPPDEFHWPPRLRMVDDLIESGRLDGLTRGQVEELLGPSGDLNVDREGWDLLYYFGPERGLFRIDSETLVIGFGADGTVERYWIYRD